MTRARAVGLLVAGFLFAVGLGISGMTQPARVIGFLDVAGDWDPTLLFVMAGAVAVYAIGHRLSLRLERPYLTERFVRGERTRVDGPLVGGAVLFGIGWGLAGYCPGPALVSLASGQTAALVFVGGMIAGIILHRASRPRSGSTRH